MKKLSLVLAFTALLLLGVGTVNAQTNIWTNVGNDGGYTSYQQMTSIGGYDWSEGSKQVTGIIYEGFENEGNIDMNKELHSDGEWILEEKMSLFGSGYSEIFKHVDAWTEDSTLWENGHPCYRNPNGQPGELAYPTELWVEYEFSTPKPFTDADTFYAIIKDAPAEQYHAYYNKYIQTDEQFAFGEKVGIGDFPSDFEPREIPEFPRMCWYEWDIQ